MTYFHIRISIEQPADILKSFCDKYFDRVICVTEEADESVQRTHHHIHGESKIKNYAAMRNKYIEHGLPIGRGQYMIRSPDSVDMANKKSVKRDQPDFEPQKHPDASGYVYVCKGTDESPPNINFDKGFSEAELSALYTDASIHRKSHPQRVKVDLSTLMERPQKPKRAKMFVERVRDEILEKYPDKTWCIDDDTDLKILTNKLYTKMGAVCKNLDNTIWCRMLNGLYSGLPKTYEQEQEEQRRLMYAFNRSRER